MREINDDQMVTPKKGQNDQTIKMIDRLFDDNKELMERLRDK